nr:uncharacterized protein LOC109159918 [Ipomoea trifida]
MAIREALSWLKDHDYDGVLLETDAQQVISQLHIANNSPYGLLLRDINNLLVLFSNVRLSFVRRSANTVAHLLARDATSTLGSRFWFGTGPPFVFRALCNDLSNI